MKVYELKVGQKFRILKKTYELLKPCGPGSAYVKELSSEKEVTIVGAFGEERTFMAPGRKYTIATTAEVDEVLKEEVS